MKKVMLFLMLIMLVSSEGQAFFKSPYKKKQTNSIVFKLPKFFKSPYHRKDLKEARIKAYLDTIAYSEGADYDTHVGGFKVKSLNKFPCRRIKVWGVVSSACGRYQILDSTYRSNKKQLGIKDFKPSSQDKIAINLLKKRGAYKDVVEGNFEKAVYKTSWEWASFPAPNGRSRYGQGSHRISKLKKYYLSRLKKHQTLTYT